ncbi:MAG: hypothetical protein JSS66_13200 [Armatimonadetes bacterium]|nr:hypothetical protein [Armatimonadota bacterium]
MKFGLFSSALVVVIASAWHFGSHAGPFSGAKGSLISTGAGEAEEAEPIGVVALRHRYMQRLNADGHMPADGMILAARQKADLLKVQGNEIAAPQWTFLGPNNVGGRVRAVVPHPTIANTIFIGSVGGGIWKTTDGGASWMPMNDNLPSLCVGALVIDKNDPNVLYAGTGESYFNTGFGENNKAAIIGAGILKSTDGGTTWTQLPSTANADFNCVARLALSPEPNPVVIAATNTGLFRSTDAGLTWTKVRSGRMMDVDFHPTDPLKVVAGFDTAPGICYSSDGGQTWTDSAGITATLRCELSWSKSVSGNVYAAVCNANAVKVWKSTNNGQTWTVKTTGSGTGNYDAYNCALWVDPTNDNNVVIGGVNCARSTNQGASLSSAFGNVHSDHHAIVEEPLFDGTTRRRVWFGGDGGIYTAANVYTNTVSALNNQLGITQFYGGAVSDSTGRVVAGAQDNFTQVYSGSLNWTGVIGGDGVYCANDPNFPAVFYAGYYYLNLFRSTDSGANFPTDITGGISDRGGNTNCNFVPWIALDPNQSNTMLAGAKRLWRSTNVRTGNPPTWTVIKPPTTDSAGGIDKGLKLDHFDPENPLNISTFAIAKTDSNVIWVGHNNGQLFKTIDGLGTSPSWTRVDLNGPLPQRWIACIVIDRNNADHVYVTYMGFAPDNVWETTDGGASFHLVVGSGARQLISAPVSSLAVDPLNAGHLLAGTDLGIFTTWDNGATWSASSQGPGTVPIDQLGWRNDTQLMAYTYGRGTWQGNVTPTPVTLSATSFSILRGVLVSGTVADTVNSDDQYLVVKNGVTLNPSESPVQVDFKTTAPNTVAQQMSIRLELSVSTVGLQSKVNVFNYDTNAWELMDTRGATLADQVIDIPINSNASKYINPATREMKIRVEVRVNGLVGSASWSGKFDQVRWTFND